MKRLWVFVLTLLLAFSICGCSKEQKNGVYPYGTQENFENYYDESQDGGIRAGRAALQKLITTGQIDGSKIGYNVAPIESICHLENPGNEENMIPFCYQEMYGYCDGDGNVIVDNQFYHAEPFSEGYAVVADGEKQNFGTKLIYRIIDQNGNIVFPTPSSEEGNYFFAESSYFKNGRIVFGKSSGASGFYICTLNAEMEYTETKIPDKSYASIYINEKDFVGAMFFEYSKGRVSLYGSSGECIHTYDYNLVMETAEASNDTEEGSNRIDHDEFNDGTYGMFFFDNGYVNVMNESGKWGLMDLSSRQMVVDYQYDYVGAYSEGVLNVCSYGRWGAVDLEGNTVIPFQYKYMGKFANGRAFAINSNDVCVVLDTKGNEVAQFDRYSLPGTNGYVPGAFSKKGVAILKDAYYNMIVINDHGQVLMKFDESDLRYYSENYITVNDVTYQIVLENG